MLKKILIVGGVLALLGIVLIIGGGYFAYNEGTSVLVEHGQQEIEKFIRSKRPSETVANSLNRILNAAKLKKSWSTAVMTSFAGMSVQDGVVSPDEAKMLDEAAHLAERGDVSREQFAAFAKKYESVIPRPEPREPRR